MNAPANISIDEIRAFLGPIPDEEYVRREKLRGYRNAATAMISTCHSNTARTLAWEAIDWIAPTLYAPASIEFLDRLIQLVSRLLRTAITAEDLERYMREAAGNA